MKIVWTKHAEDRQKEWEKKLGITKQEVENALNIPGQIVPGDMGVLVAQKKPVTDYCEFLSERSTKTYKY